MWIRAPWSNATWLKSAWPARRLLAHPAQYVIYTSALSQVEVISALQRRVREGSLAEAQAQRLAHRVTVHFAQRYQVVALTQAVDQACGPSGPSVARRCGPPGVCLDDPADHTGAGPATAQLCCGGYRLAHGGHRRRVRRGRSAAAPLSPARTGLCGVTQVQGVAAASIAATPPVGCPVPSTEYPGHSGNHDTLAQELPASLA